MIILIVEIESKMDFFLEILINQIRVTYNKFNKSSITSQGENDGIDSRYIYVASYCRG